VFASGGVEWGRRGGWQENGCACHGLRVAVEALKISYLFLVLQLLVLLPLPVPLPLLISIVIFHAFLQQRHSG